MSVHDSKSSREAEGEAKRGVGRIDVMRVERDCCHHGMHDVIDDKIASACGSQ